ncbi:MAG: TRAM domain-containing protein [Planctomycetes bacterium]|nr:TRAM domain-containing protein [Planctomycetota bacterium]
MFFALLIGIASATLFYYVDNDRIVVGLLSFIAVVFSGAAVVGIDLLARNKQITTISAIYFGLLLGFLLGYLLWIPLEPMLTSYLDISLKEKELVRIFITLVSCYVCVSTLLQTKDEFRFIIPYVEFSKQVKGPKPLVLDTSVIIDGRIADICDTGIIDSKMIVPRFVLQELQGIADSSDKIKRNRGRRGLDILKRMQSNPKVELQMHEANIVELRDVHKVDERLVVLANVLGARVVTNDFNLNKISQLQGVEVINLNELANALKLVALPGENLPIRIVKQGDQIGQGVGYLDDGTMVVVEHGKQAIGQEVSITVTSVLQTPAGRMIFGRIDGKP